MAGDTATGAAGCPMVCEIPHMLLPVSVDMGSTTSHRVACESVTR